MLGGYIVLRYCRDNNHRAKRQYGNLGNAPGEPLMNLSGYVADSKTLLLLVLINGSATYNCNAGAGFD